MEIPVWNVGDNSARMTGPAFQQNVWKMLNCLAFPWFAYWVHRSIDISNTSYCIIWLFSVAVLFSEMTFPTEIFHWWWSSCLLECFSGISTVSTNHCDNLYQICQCLHWFFNFTQAHPWTTFTERSNTHHEHPIRTFNALNRFIIIRHSLRDVHNEHLIWTLYICHDSLHVDIKFCEKVNWKYGLTEE